MGTEDHLMVMRTCSPANPGNSSEEDEMVNGCHEDEDNGTLMELPCPAEGKRSFKIRGVVFTVHEKYELLKVIGVGAYGVVMAAIDNSTGEHVALKKISGVFEDITDAKRILREIRLMQALQHENILPLYDMEAPVTLDNFEEIYMVSPLFDKDLCKIIESDLQLTDEHIRYFIYQILCALKYLHSASVMHRDLKPANILVKESCDLALCDFGLARYVEESNDLQNGMTEYVVTRWYRAPELVLTHEYTNAVDLWAVGCIMGDLFGRKVMFPGRDFKHQVETICEVIGKPSEDDITHVTSNRARKFLEKLPDTDGIALEQLFPNAPKDGIDLMANLLKFNPAKRLTAEQALDHPYVAEYHEPEFEKSATGTINMSDLEPRSPDGSELTLDELRLMMLHEIHKFRPQAPVFTNNPTVLSSFR